MMSGGLAHHPAGNMRQRSIELMDDEHVSAMETLTPNNNHNVPAARMKRIMNPLTVAVIPGSMSLLRPELARRISPSPSREAASVPARGAGSTMSSIWSIGSKPRPVTAGRAGSPITSPAWISSFSTNSAIEPVHPHLRAGMSPSPTRLNRRNADGALNRYASGSECGRICRPLA